MLKIIRDTSVALMLALLLVGWFSAPGFANRLNHSSLANHFHSLPSGRVIPLVCNNDGSGGVSANFVNIGGQLTLQLNCAGDANDIVGALIDGYLDKVLHSVQVDFKGPCLPPNSSNVPEGPNVFALGNDAFGNGVLAIANCESPSSQTSVGHGFTQELFLADAFQTVLTTDPGQNFYPLVKLIGLDIEVSGNSTPLYVKGIRVNGTTTSFDTKPKDQLGCLPIFSPF